MSFAISNRANTFYPQYSYYSAQDKEKSTSYTKTKILAAGALLLALMYIYWVSLEMGREENEAKNKVMLEQIENARQTIAFNGDADASMQAFREHRHPLLAEDNKRFAARTQQPNSNTTESPPSYAESLRNDSKNKNKSKSKSSKSKK